MNMNWITILGGGFAAAATLAAGVSMSGLTTPVEPPATEAPVAETIYVEQPVIEIPGLSLGGAAALPPIVDPTEAPADRRTKAGRPPAAAKDPGMETAMVTASNDRKARASRASVAPARKARSA